MSNFLNVLNERSSIRKFTDQEIPADICKQLIEAGLKAPTAANKQEIHFSVVKGDNPIQKEIQNDLNPNAENSFYFNAPIIMYLSGPDDFKWSPVDAGIAVENIHLTAKALGLGSVILGCMVKIVNGEKKEYYQKKLCIPEGNSLLIAVAIGYPDTEKTPHTFDFEKNVTIV